jgi:hypothetical protein
MTETKRQDERIGTTFAVTGSCIKIYQIYTGKFETEFEQEIEISRCLFFIPPPLYLYTDYLVDI